MLNENFFTRFPMVYIAMDTAYLLTRLLDLF